MALEDKDKDGSYVDPQNPENVPASLRDPDDNNATIKAGEVQPGNIGLDSRPTVSISTKSETDAEIRAEFKVMFGEDVPKEIAQSYYNQLSALQGARSTKRYPTKGEVDVVYEGVSAQERRQLLDNLLKNYATQKLAAAKAGDPKAISSLQKGAFGVTYTTLKKAYADNGIPFNESSLGKLAVESSVDSKILNSNINLINLQAKTYFPALADKIDKGYTVRQLLTPYLQTRANILEEDADAIDLKELQSVANNPKGLMGLYDYEVSLRKDPRWKFTKNAIDSMSSLAKGLGQTFGAIG